MEIAELRERIARWENLHTDFKERIDSPEELAKDLVAFANTDGGQLILGVAKDRSVAGVGDVDAVNRSVDNVAYNNCEPPITVVQEVLTTEDGRHVVVVNVAKGDLRPYRTNRGRYYVRTTSGCRDASREELLRLFQSTESLFYDETPVFRAGIQDLDLNAFNRYIEETGQPDLGLEPLQLLRNWGLLAGEHPTIAGLLLFGLDPQRHLPFAQINAAAITGTDLANDPFDRKDIKGQLLDIIADAHRFLYIHVRIPHEIRGFEPEAKPEIPLEALREAVVNAVAHRDYTLRGPIRIFAFDDRIEIHTPGKPPNSVDTEAMRSGVHVPRNPRIYSRLADAGMVTGAGSGIRRMIKLLRESGGRDLGIEIREFEVVFTLPRR